MHCTQVNGSPIDSLDTFLEAVSSIPSGAFARLRTVTFNRFVRVITIRTNSHYFGTWEIRKEEYTDMDVDGEVNGEKRGEWSGSGWVFSSYT